MMSLAEQVQAYCMRNNIPVPVVPRVSVHTITRVRYNRTTGLPMSREEYELAQLQRNVRCCNCAKKLKFEAGRL